MKNLKNTFLVYLLSQNYFDYLTSILNFKLN